MPARTPTAIVNRINKDVTAALQSPDVIRQLKDRGIDATPSSGAEYLSFVRSEQKRWGPVIKRAKIEAN
jgi:tripartite-type tricarboxylate transporter receptor subunit TctC